MTSPAIGFSFHCSPPVVAPKIYKEFDPSPEAARKNGGGDGGCTSKSFGTKLDETFPGGGALAAAQEIEDGDGKFEFEFSSQFERVHLSAADDLFAGGKIKPLVEFSLRDSVKRRNEQRKQERERLIEIKRGRGSVSPLRVCDILVDNNPENCEPSLSRESYRSKFFSSKSFSFPSSHKKWKLKDLFLFRNSSEGRSPKYSILNKKSQERDEAKFSFRLRENRVGESVEGRGTRGATEVRWKTTLPYKHGLLAGCLGFNFPIIDDVAKHKSIVRY